MDRQAIDRWFLLMHGIFHHVPDRLHRTNVTGTYMIHYLIYILSDSNSGIAMTLVYILVNILDGLDRGTDFDIDMTVIVCGQIGIIRDNITIVKGMTLSIGTGSTIVGAGIVGITIFAIAGFRTELLWIVLAALAINHANCFWMIGTTKTMHHALCDGGIEHGMSNRVRDLNRDNGINMRGITGFEVLPQKNEEVDMSTLLKLYGEDKALDIHKEATIYVFEHGLDLLSKDACINVRVILGCLMFPGLTRVIIIIFICEQIVINL